MNSRIIRCVKTTSNRTITNGNRLLTAKCWNGPADIIQAMRSRWGQTRDDFLSHHPRIMIQPISDVPKVRGSAFDALEGVLETQQLEVSIGPQHPSTHGVFRMDATLDGGTVVKLKPVMGYLHRNHEKIAELAPSYLASMPYTDRLDYFCSMTNNWAYALSVEKLAGIEVPERAEYIRVIL